MKGIKNLTRQGKGERVNKLMLKGKDYIAYFSKDIVHRNV